MVFWRDENDFAKGAMLNRFPKVWPPEVFQRESRSDLR
jgi:hypothetical protein